MKSIEEQLADVAAEKLIRDIDNKIINEIIILAKEDEGWIRVRIPWRTGQGEEWWNVTCAWAIEHFGLPGDRYMTHPTEDFMDFVFRDDKDAAFFKLRWS